MDALYYAQVHLRGSPEVFHPTGNSMVTGHSLREMQGARIISETLCRVLSTNTALLRLGCTQTGSVETRGGLRDRWTRERRKQVGRCKAAAASLSATIRRLYAAITVLSLTAFTGGYNAVHTIDSCRILNHWNEVSRRGFLGTT